MTRKNTNLMIVAAALLGATRVTAIAGPVDISSEKPIIDDTSPVLVSPIAEVLAAQGQTSVDFNCDGVVGIQDFLILMARESFDINTFLDMMATWGTADYDVNCDLIVDLQDVFQVAAQSSHDAQAFVDAFLSHWGEVGTPYDLNCDDVVNSLDLLQLVTSGLYDITEVLGMLADWGTSPHMFDLNCDGVVGIQDFLLGLAAITDSDSHD